MNGERRHSAADITTHEAFPSHDVADSRWDSQPKHHHTILLPPPTEGVTLLLEVILLSIASAIKKESSHPT